MKKLALVILAGISFASANAQFQFGAKAGANFSTITGSDAADNSTLVNFNAGIFLRLPLVDRLSIQPELVYSVQGAKASGSSESNHLNYFNIPILLKYAAGAGFAVETGPQLGFLLGAHDKLITQSENFVDVRNHFRSECHRANSLHATNLKNFGNADHLCGI